MKDKIPPAPWYVYDIGDDVWCVADATGRYVPGLERFVGEQAKAVADSVVAEHNAFDIMMRRGWHPVRIVSGPWAGGWFMKNEFGHTIAELGLPNSWPGPVTALIHAEEWFKEHVGK